MTKWQAWTVTILIIGMAGIMTIALLPKRKKERNDKDLLDIDNSSRIQLDEID